MNKEVMSKKLQTKILSNGKYHYTKTQSNQSDPNGEGECLFARYCPAPPH